MEIKLKTLLITTLLVIGCSEPKVQKPINRGKGDNHKVDKSISLSQSINKSEYKLFKKYFKKHNITNYKVSNNGFYYQSIKNTKNNNFPKENDKVILEGEIRKFNDTVLYKYDSQSPLTFKIEKSNTARTLSEAVSMMNEGDEYEFYFLSYNGFGFHGDDKKIPPLTPLIFKLKLIKIIN